MGTLTLTDALEDYAWLPDFLEAGDGAAVVTRTGTLLRWQNADGSTVEVVGTGFAYLDGKPVAGTVSTVRILDGATVLARMTGLSTDLQQFHARAFGWNGRDADGWDALSLLIAQDDVIRGSENGDDLIGGVNTGNDTVLGNGGDDFIKGDAGNDSIDGGTGGDTLTYSESFYNAQAFKGIVADLGAGTVEDCWGGNDVFSGIERFEGSSFGDVIRASDEGDQFMGLRGNDTLIGGDGFDEALYWRDAQFGGVRGILVDFAEGTIRDGFGNIDSVSAIESVIGTEQADTYRGGGGDDQFLGGGGADRYFGGRGRDTVNFSYGPADTGARVDLRLTSSQVLTDGFGNVETLVSIERIDGNELGDNFTGNGAANGLVGDRGDDVMRGLGGNDLLQGDAGADTLSGGGGADEFRYERREGHDPWGDVITDFASGTDRLAFRVGDFAGMDDVLRFQNGTGPGGTGSWFWFDAGTRRLYWDADGTGAGDAVEVARLVGVTALAAGDFDLQ
jgi:serralysin